MIRLNKINKYYGKNHALKNVSISFTENELVFIMGESGSGKSTLLNIIGCIDRFDNGTYVIANKNLKKDKISTCDNIRNSIFSFIFQDFHMIDNLNIEENILFPDLNDRNDIHLNNVLEKLNISELRYRKVNEISGGQLQRVVIARALYRNSKVILADEPTGNLDDENTRIIFEILKELSINMLVIVVSHDVIAANSYSDRIISINNGSIIGDGRNYLSNFYVERDDYDKTKMNFKDFIEFLTTIEEGKTNIIINKNTKKNSKSNREFIQFNQSFNKHISIKNLLLYLKKVFMKFKLKYFLFSVVSLVITFFISICVYFITYDVNISISNYIKDSSATSYNIYTESSYENFNGTNETKKIRNGILLYESIPSQHIYRFKKRSLSISGKSFFANLTYDKYHIESINTIYITDYISDTYKIYIGDEINLYDRVLLVEKVITTDYKNMNLKDKNYDQNRIIEDRGLINIYCNEKIFNLDFNDIIIDIKYSNFIYSDLNSSYFNSVSLTSSICNIDIEHMIAGKIPENNNEIIITSKFLEENDIQIQDILGKTFNFKDIYLEKYNRFYKDELNLFDYYINGVEIVGICKDDKIDYYLHESIFNNIKRNKCLYFYPDFYSVSTQYILSEIDSLNENLIIIDEMNIDFFYVSNDFIITLKNILYISLIIFILLDLTILIIFINTIYQGERITIGLCKTLGVKNIYIYLTYSIFFSIFLITVFLGTISVNLSALFYMNRMINSNIVNSSFNLLYYLNKNIILLLILYSFITIIITTLNLLYFVSKEPIKILKNK